MSPCTADEGVAAAEQVPALAQGGPLAREAIRHGSGQPVAAGKPGQRAGLVWLAG